MSFSNCSNYCTIAFPESNCATHFRGKTFGIGVFQSARYPRDHNDGGKTLRGAVRDEEVEGEEEVRDSTKLEQEMLNFFLLS